MNYMADVISSVGALFCVNDYCDVEDRIFSLFFFPGVCELHLRLLDDSKAFENQSSPTFYFFFSTNNKSVALGKIWKFRNIAHN